MDRHRAGYKRPHPQTAEYYRSRRARREFVAVDGEGAYADGDPDQRYVLLSDSTGRSVWNGNGLSTRECLEFLLGIPSRDPKVRTVGVGFGLSYDVENWLRDLPPAKWDRLLGKWHDCLWGPYRLRYLKGKWFEVWRVENGKGYVRIDDTASLFGGSFLSVVKEWLGDAASPTLSEGKDRRTHFTLADRAFMETYNSEENRLMVAIMLRFQAAVDAIGARPAHYSSPAILGKWFLTQHNSKQFIPRHVGIEEPAEVVSAYQRAFFGGHIEAAGVGRTHGPVHNIDLNSAYPKAITSLPNLASGSWVRGGESEWTMYRVRWDFREVERRFYPFPFRDARGRVNFPPCGTAWIWSPELEAAREVGDLPADAIQVLDSWAFVPNDPNDRPFAWVADLYLKRAELKAKKDPAQYPLKIAYNSIYGAFAQQLSLDPNKKPTYHHMGYAGMITSYTRAALYGLIREDEEETVAVATDGIYYSAERGVRTARSLFDSTALGEGKVTSYLEMESLQSGVYRLRHPDGCACGKCVGGWEAFGRGYGGARVPWDDIERAWAEHRETVRYVGKDRFVGHRLAAARGKPDSWGKWEPVPRSIKLAVAGTKRNPLPRADLTDPSAGIVWTAPNSNFYPEAESCPYSFNKDRAKAEIDWSVASVIEDDTAEQTLSAV